MSARKLLRVAIVALVVALAAAASLSRRYAAFPGEVFIDIPKGTGVAEVARLMAEAGVVQFRWQFLAVRVLRPRAKVMAGEYHFSRPASPWEVFDRLSRGDVFFQELVVPEGSNMYDIAGALDRLGTNAAHGFLDAAGDASLIRDMAPEARNLEGYLFPATYRVTRHSTAGQLCAEMTSRFRRAWREAGGDGDVHKTVTLASLVEKESAIAAERPTVAGVYTNRLRIGMPLQCDPTVIYASLAEGRYRGAIYRSDLENRHPYNTYMNPGLPPGPISNAGAGALRAALHPAETKYLYFVAIPGGGGAHRFSETLESHQQAVAKYRRANNHVRQAQTPERVSRKSAAGRGGRARVGRAKGNPRSGN
jgi:UPF0755 protein